MVSEAQERNCPLCGHARVELLGYAYQDGRCYWGNILIPLTITQARVFNYLYAKRNTTLSFEALFHFLYSHDPNGGPLDEKIAIKRHIHRITKILKELNLPIRIRSYSKVGYYMVFL